MHRSILFGIVFLLATIALTACRTSTPTVGPTSVPPTTASTNTPVSTGTPVPTNTPAPTNTPEPTNTPRPTNTPTPTATPSRRTLTQLTSAQANSAVRGQNVIFSAQVTNADGSAPTGTIFFTYNNTFVPVAGCTVPVPVNSSGVATCETNYLGTGTNLLVATYSGDANHDASSSPLSITIRSADTTVSI